MELTTRGIPPTADERAAVDDVLGPVDPGQGGRVVREGLHAARQRRHLLLPTLLALQDRIGWVSPAALDYVCERLLVPPAEAYGVAGFYALISTEPRPPLVLHVCDDVACLARGRAGSVTSSNVAGARKGRVARPPGIGARAWGVATPPPPPSSSGRDPASGRPSST
jgi:hypothetical protein